MSPDPNLNVDSIPSAQNSVNASHDRIVSPSHQPAHAATDNAVIAVVEAVATDTGGVTDVTTNNKDVDDMPVIRLTLLEFGLVYTGLVLAILLYALDQTIVSPAVPALIKEFAAIDQIPWVGSAYMLTATSFAPLYGKLSDTFGRKPVLLFAVITFEIGSALCAIASTMSVLIIGRAISGVGGGGIYSLVFIITSDMVRVRDRGWYHGWFSAVFGVASIVGPIIGGVFTEYVSWRWCFYINLPIGFVTVAVVILFLKTGATDDRGVGIWNKVLNVDFIGTTLIVLSIVCLVMPLQNGGGIWAWSDWRTIFMFILSAILIGVCIRYEQYGAKDPIIPSSVFESMSVVLLLIVAGLNGVVFFGVLFYLPSYFILVNQDSATTGGLQIIPLLVTVSFVSMGSSMFLNKRGMMKLFLCVGGVVMCAGVTLLSFLTVGSGRAEQICYQILAGVGIGLVIQTRLTGLQSVVSQSHIAVATGLSNLCQLLGGTIGVAVIGTVFNNVLTATVDPYLADIVINNATRVRELPPDVSYKAVKGFSDAFNASYRVLIPASALIFVASVFVKESEKPRTDGDQELQVMAMH